MIVALAGMMSLTVQAQTTQPSVKKSDPAPQYDNTEGQKIHDLMNKAKDREAQGKTAEITKTDQPVTKGTPVTIRVIDRDAEGKETEKREAQGIEQRKLFSPSYPLPNKTDRAVGKSEQWVKRDATIVMAGQGKVVYMYGQTMPEIVTAPLHITDIELDEGETVQSVQIGDNVRWKVNITVSGSNTDDNKRTHIIVSPLDAGLQTSMMIATDQRSYHLLLTSTRERWMPYVGFQYPQKQKAAELAIAKAMMEKKKEEEKNTTVSTGQRILDLDFGYTIEGKAAWKPIRVYSDEGRIYIQMPKSIRAKTAPVITGLGDHEDFIDAILNERPKEIINYRVRGTVYVVDGLHDRLVMFVGVGDDQQKVLITKTK